MELMAGSVRQWKPFVPTQKISHFVQNRLYVFNHDLSCKDCVHDRCLFAD